MIVFSGSSNKPLAKKLAERLKVKLGSIQLSRFANAEVRVRITEKIANGMAVVVQSLSTPPDENLVEFCLVCDALKRMGVSRIVGVIPWLGYSKQDKVFRVGEPLSVKVIAQMLQVVPLNMIVTLELHNPSILGFFDVPVKNLSARPLFVKYFKKLIRSKAGTSGKNEFVVVAPDAGAVKDSTNFAQELGVEAAYVDKKRDLATGKVSIRGISRDISGKNIAIFDDMIVTGSTLIETSKFLKKKGAGKIFIAATHHLYLEGVDRKLAKSDIDHLIVTDSIKKPGKKLHTNMTEISCAEMIAKCLKDYI